MFYPISKLIPLCAVVGFFFYFAKYKAIESLKHKKIWTEVRTK